MQHVAPMVPGEEEFLHAEMDNNGRISVGGRCERGSSAGQLRGATRKIQADLQCWLYAQLRYPGLADLTIYFYRDTANYVLGPKVMGLKMDDDFGEPTYSSWADCMRCEHAFVIRPTNEMNMVKLLLLARRSEESA